MCNSWYEETFQTCFKYGRHSQVLQSHPLPISSLSKTPETELSNLQGMGCQSTVMRFKGQGSGSHGEVQCRV